MCVCVCVCNRPYEVYHYGALFVAHLVGQCHYADGSREYWRILGPAIELLIWIPKKADADTVNGQRPLQLPPCLHRIYGSSVMECTGPAAEPLLTSDQAAIRGSDCGRNLRKVSAFLGEFSADNGQDSPGNWELLQRLYGPLAPGVRHYVLEAQRIARDVPELQRAVFLNDQEKAFERMGHQWMIYLFGQTRLDTRRQQAFRFLFQNRQRELRFLKRKRKPFF